MQKKKNHEIDIKSERDREEGVSFFDFAYAWKEMKDDILCMGYWA